MTERKPRKKKKVESEEPFVLSKDELVVAKYLRFNLTTKKSTLYGDAVEYFMGSQAVDLLLDSKWAKKEVSSVVFTDRESVSDFLNKMLKSDKFRHVNLIRTEKKVKEGKDGKKKEKTDEKKSEEKKSEEKKSDEKKSEEKKVVEDDGKSTPKGKKGKKGKDGKETRKVKKKVKITLEVHDHQYFFDAEDEAYGWFFDPISAKTFALGILLVLAVIGICLFPLWPESVREYSWYISVAGAIFVGFILVLAIMRYVVYAVLWLFTLGKLDFWMLLNLTAECGFCESFVPADEYSFKAKPKDDDDEDEDALNEDEIDDTPAAETEDPAATIATEEVDEQVTMVTDADEQADEGSGDEVAIDDENGSSEEGREGDWVRLEKDDAENGCHGDEAAC